MKGTLTDEQRERMIREANEADERKRGHAWWMSRLSERARKAYLRQCIHAALAGGSAS